MNDIQTTDGEEVLRSLVSASVAGTLLVNQDSIIEMVNAPVLKMFGYQEDELSGQSLDKLIPMDKRKAHHKHTEKFLKKPSSKAMASKRLVYGLHQSGYKFPVEVKLSPMRLNGRLHVIAMITDITIQKKIRDWNTLLFKAFQESINGIYLVDAQSLRFHDVNHGAQEQLGYTWKEIENLYPWDVQFAQDEAHFRSLIKPLQLHKHRKINFEAALKRKNKTTLPTEIQLQRFKYDGEDVYMLIAIDISERKQAEEALVMQSEITRNLAEGVILLKPADGLVLYTNTQFDNMFGFRQHELHGQRFFEICPYTESVVDEIQDGIARNGKWVKEHQCPRKGASPFWSRISFSKFVHPKYGEVWLGVFSDIDNAKKAELALVREQEKALRYLNVAAAVFVVVDKNQKVSLINQYGCQLLGYPEEEIIGRDWFECFLPPDIRNNVKAVFLEAISGKMENLEFYENPILTRDGRERMMEWHNVLLRDETGQVIALLSSGIDITDKRKAEQDKTKALIQGQEIERKRVAEELHDGIGQSLTAINIHLSSLENLLEENHNKRKSKVKALQKMMIDATQEVKQISRALKPSILDEHGLIKSLELLAKTVSEGQQLQIQLYVFNFDEEPDYTVNLCVYRVVQEILNNIIQHANATKVDIQIIQHEGHIVLTCEDNGVGFDMEAHEAHSSGLGLKNIKTRVGALSGTLEVESGQGKGTLIIVEVPLYPN